MKALTMIFELCFILNAQSALAQFQPKGFSNLPVRNVANDSRQGASALADIKCVAAANRLIQGFELGISP